ncbi:MAG: polysaccharide biosynthesis C-terminal domain-containing protein [Candidatus Heimdallarchaeota archaeon]
MVKNNSRKELKIDFSRERKFFEQEGSSRVLTSGSLYMFFALINAGCIWVFIILATGWEGLKYFGLTTAINGIIGLMGIGISRYFIAEIKTAFLIDNELGQLKAATYSKILFLIGLVIGLGLIATPFMFGFFITNQLLRECIFASGFASILLYSNYVLQIGLEIKNRYDIIAFLSIFGGIFLLLWGLLFVNLGLNPFWFAFYPFFNISTFFLFLYFFNRQAPYSIRDIFRAGLRTRTMKRRAKPQVRELIEEHQILLYLKNSLYSMLTNIQNSKFFEDILFFFAAIYLAIFTGAAYQGFALSLLTVLMTYGAVKTVILYYSAPLNIEIAEACVKNDHVTIEDSINDATRISSILALGFLTAMVALSGKLLFYLHRDLFIDGGSFNTDIFLMSQILFILIVLGQFIYGYSTLFGNALIGSGNAITAAKGFMATLIIITCLSPICIYLFHILGIGIVMLISALFLLPYSLIQLKRKLNITYRIKISRLIPNLIILFLLLWFFPFFNTFSLIIGIIIGASFYLILNPFFGISIPNDLQMINDLFNTLKLKIVGDLIVNAMKNTYNFSPLNNDKIVLEENKLILVKKGKKEN